MFLLVVSQSDCVLVTPIVMQEGLLCLPQTWLNKGHTIGDGDA